LDRRLGGPHSRSEHGGVEKNSHPEGKKPLGRHKHKWESSNGINFREVGWEKLHNDELQSLYSSPNIVRVIKSRRMRWVGHVARMGEGRGVYRVLVGRPEGKRPLGRPRRRWKDNIKVDLRELLIDGANRIRLALDRFHWRAFVNAVMNLRVP
jgi:hypothetical protein